MATADLVLELVNAFAQLLVRALNGDKAAQRKVRDILPVRLKTRFVREAERRKDARKFRSVTRG